jgi:two-component system, OmpR family, sensor histidine kinase MtrB
LRLRARITLAFALGSMLLSVLLAATTYGLTRDNLLGQRERASLEQALTNAATAQNLLRPLDPDTQGELIVDLLESLPSVSDATPLLNIAGQWRTGGTASFEDLPEELRTLSLEEGQVGRMRYSRAGRPTLAVGVPLPQVSATYFEVVPLDELESSLRSLALILLVAGAVTTFAGATLGVWAASRVLRPVGEVGAAAEAIAGGLLETRLEEDDDPDLTPLVNSFNRMAAALQERIHRDARFASDVSHELRSPLMTLRASIEVMVGRRDELSERAAAALDLLVHDVDRFERLIGDLLEISRIDAGATDAAWEDTNPAELVRQVVAANGRNHIPLHISAEAEQTIIRADKRRLGQVLTNLLDNAEYYAGGASAVDVARHNGTVTLVVEDLGPGIPDDERERIFERFARGSTSGSRGAGGGTGLGLALVQEHVRLHGGRVRVEPRSDARAGSRFIVELPVVE